MGYKGCKTSCGCLLCTDRSGAETSPLTRYVHGCVHILRILQGSNEAIKSTFYVPKMNIKKAVKMVCLDIMSRRNQIKETWTAFGQNVQTEERGDCLNDMKTEILRVRMTPEEKAALNRQASLHHKTMSEYIRSVAKCPPDVTRDEFESSIVRMIYEINKIGVNINQIAKKYNEHNYVEPSEELLCKLDEVYGMMKHTIRIMKGDRNVAHY